MKRMIDRGEAIGLAAISDTAGLMGDARALRDEGFGNVVTYSRKVFIPLTHLCRDVCHYCTFAQTPKKIGVPYLSIETRCWRRAVRRQCSAARKRCSPSATSPSCAIVPRATRWRELGHDSTLGYLAEVARAGVRADRRCCPTSTPACMDAGEIAPLRPVSASMGIMLESSRAAPVRAGHAALRLTGQGPGVRLDTIRLAGEARVPFTSGILIGIGETRLERIEALLALRDLHQRTATCRKSSSRISAPSPAPHGAGAGTAAR
jgi:FO synthase